MINDTRPLSIWLIRTGYALLALSIISSLAEFLPVNFWETVGGWLTNSDANTFYKIVPSESGGLNFCMVAVIGALLIFLGRINLRRGRDS
ncbi:hypothetical protein FKG94_10310 [Exilibacterium tricleocarpae]|uniref:Uncharacterized protein n=1 Tax=Exilibacterium tricleocarpae TaxID=2591008 RepID=A0A545TS60_9GAMM|nr:hypothetical protein FKG94_10310 [Exilibacterium tricleocarpae]